MTQPKQPRANRKLILEQAKTVVAKLGHSWSGGDRSYGRSATDETNYTFMEGKFKINFDVGSSENRDGGFTWSTLVIMDKDKKVFRMKNHDVVRYVPGAWVKRLTRLYNKAVALEKTGAVAPAKKSKKRRLSRD